MTYNEFYKSIIELKNFIKEQNKLQDIIEIISPTSTGVVEFGGKFIDSYINIIEIALGDNSKWVSWFVFENNFGKENLEVIIEGKSFKISNEKCFYNICIININH